MTELRPYQEQALQAIRDSVRGGVRRLVVQAPTGAGKTRVAAAIVEGALRKGNRLCFVVPAISLIDQAIEMFNAEGIDNIGVIQADHAMTDWSKPVQIMDATAGGWHSGPWKPCVRYDEANPGKMFVFFDGVYSKNEPGPFPFVFTLGCLEVERPE